MRPGWDQIFFHGMGWELPVPRQARTRTGMGQDLGGIEAPIPVLRPVYFFINESRILNSFKEIMSELANAERIFSQIRA